MQNFIFWNPTKIVFGKGMLAKIGHAALHGKRALLVYGALPILTGLEARLNLLKTPS